MNVDIFFPGCLMKFTRQPRQQLSLAGCFIFNFGLSVSFDISDSAVYLEHPR